MLSDDRRLYFLVILLVNYFTRGVQSDRANALKKCGSTTSSNCSNEIASNKGWMDGRCPVYQNNTCSSILKDTRVYARNKEVSTLETEVTNRLLQFKQVIEIFNVWTVAQIIFLSEPDNLTNWQIDIVRKLKRDRTGRERCWIEGKNSFCHMFLPKCEVYLTNNEYFIKEVPLCREKCLKMKETCADILLFASFFNKETSSFIDVNCDTLPEGNSDASANGCLDTDSPHTAPTPTTKWTSTKKIYTTKRGNITRATTATPYTTANKEPSTTTTIVTTRKTTPDLTTTLNVTSRNTKKRKKTQSQTTKGIHKPTKETQKTTARIQTTLITTKTATRDNEKNDAGSKKGGKRSDMRGGKSVLFMKNHTTYFIISGGALFVILTVIAAVCIKKRLSKLAIMRNYPEESVEGDGPYSVEPFSPENIGRMMTGVADEPQTGEEDILLSTPPPVPNATERAPLKDIKFLDVFLST